MHIDDFAGHSLRAGLATQAGLYGASELAVMKQPGIGRSPHVRKYICEGSLFATTPLPRLGL